MRISYWSSDVCSADLRFEDLAAVGVDAAQFTFVTFPGAVPEVAIDPAHAGDETVRFDRAQDLAAVRIDLMNLALAVLAHPQRTLGPGHAGIAAATRRSEEHTSELQSIMRISYAVFCLKNKKQQ